MADLIEIILLIALYWIPVKIAANLLKAERRYAVHCIVAAILALVITQLSGFSGLESGHQFWLNLAGIALAMSIILDTKLLTGLAMAGIFYVSQIILTIGGHRLLDMLA